MEEEKDLRALAICSSALKGKVTCSSVVKGKATCSTSLKRQVTCNSALKEHVICNTSLQQVPCSSVMKMVNEKYTHRVISNNSAGYKANCQSKCK
ncbi:hypothetical protein H5410_001767 [Solanum commersonii]|uniref:Uncharacterized protein n=1 Tax=Solanum commersonii TaxID=4109 RepID=A0A9J6B0H6_SOLCO|nr:hypothetical protein H5410_001767 [Solanum commersonii]